MRRSSSCGYGSAAGRPHLRVHADRREAGDGVQLVDVQHRRLSPRQQEVDARHAGAVDRLERRDRQPPDLVGLRRRSAAPG